MNYDTNYKKPYTLQKTTATYGEVSESFFKAGIMTEYFIDSKQIYTQHLNHIY